MEFSIAFLRADIGNIEVIFVDQFQNGHHGAGTVDEFEFHQDHIAELSGAVEISQFGKFAVRKGKLFLTAFSLDKMVFIALPPTVYSTGSYQDISNTRIKNFIIPALKEVVARTGAIIIDTHTPTGGNSNLMKDGVHPNDTGKQILCETIAAAIKTKTEV